MGICKMRGTPSHHGYMYQYLKWSHDLDDWQIGGSPMTEETMIYNHLLLN